MLEMSYSRASLARFVAGCKAILIDEDVLFSEYRLGPHSMDRSWNDRNTETGFCSHCMERYLRAILRQPRR
jgi:hypothetical protein